MSFIFRIIVFAGIFTSVASYELTEERNVIIITDMETDDRIAIAVASIRMPERILFIGTTLMNSQRKAALVEDQLRYFSDLKNVKVFAGTGLTADEYPDMNSTKAGRSYTHEGEGILDRKKLKKFGKSSATSSSNKLQKEIRKTLNEARAKGIHVEFVLLAAPTDLMAVLAGNEHVYANVIHHIHVMAGWVDIEGTPNVKRTTYNTNMDVVAASQLMKFAHDYNVDTTLWSSHSIKKEFGGGTINVDNYPDLIRVIFDSTADVLQTIQRAGESWDKHLMDTIPTLRNVIGRHAGRQFTPADPLVIVGILNPNIIRAQRNVLVKINQAGDETGYPVEVKENRRSAIKVVEEIDVHLFIAEMQNSFRAIIDAAGGTS